MVERSGGYRDKYLQLLEEQERADRQYKYQLDLMRKTIINLSGATQGLDKSLDATLINLRDAMRGASGPRVVEQLERVEQAVVEFERNRGSENALAARRLGEVLAQYQDLRIPKQLKTGIKSFEKSLKKRLSNYRQYPEALEELTKLQNLAFEAALNPEASLWERIRGGRTLASAESEQSETASQPKAEGDEGASDAQAADNFGRSAPEQTEELELSETKKAPAELDFDAGDEDSYEAVAKRIAGILKSLVDRIDPNDVVRHKVDIVRLRIDRGMDWYALAVTLEDIRDILFLRYLQVDKEFSDYLSRVNNELQSIRQALGDSEARHLEELEAAGTFSDRVEDQVGKIHQSINDTNEIDQLKQEVKNHLSFIHDALADYRQSQSSDVALSEQLKALVDRVHSVENESIKTKELLEEERKRATHDPLTELPNREAYNERAYHELTRHKRYGHPLTLAVCDIDFFKKINDGFGHQAGDKVLKLIAKVVSTRLREVDFVARYGGEEFVILMPETSSEQAFGVLDKVRASVAKTPFRFKEKPVNITLSFGLSEFIQDDTVETVFARADKALYKAKDSGRNCCINADSE